MKRAIVFLVLLTAFTAVGSAQFFVEGSMSAGYNAGQSLFWDAFATPTNIFFKVSPLSGYQLNDKIAVGAKASIVRIKQKTISLDPDTGDEVPLERRAPEWSFAVLGRYKLLGSKKISFLVEGSAYISEKKTMDNSSSSSVYKSNESVSAKGVSLLPLVTYDLSEKWSIIATGDFLRLDLSSKTERNMDTGFVAKRNHFGFTGQSILFRRVPEIRVGVIYHFNKSSR